jgi:hypothetical protein
LRRLSSSDDYRLCYWPDLEDFLQAIFKTIRAASQALRSMIDRVVDSFALGKEIEVSLSGSSGDKACKEDR